jgi:putative SOS response-associated peptidase YedK
MCGRYVIEGTTELSERFQLRQIPADLFPEWTTYNAAPTQLLPVILEDAQGERTALPMQWGLVPRWRRPDGKAGVAPINARAETLDEKPMFRGLVKAKRCIVPASGFYEWQKVGGRKYDVTHEDENNAAGSFTIITTAANSLVAPLHERMPAILRREDEEEWVSRDVTDPLQVERLLQPYPEEAMRVYAVSPDVNSPRNNGPELIEPDQDDS